MNETIVNQIKSPKPAEKIPFIYLFAFFLPVSLGRVYAKTKLGLNKIT